MASKCAGCGKFKSPQEGVTCSGCRNVSYHRACIDVAEDAEIPPTWMCPTCTIRKKPRDNRDDTPVSGGSSYIMDESMVDMSLSTSTDTAHNATIEVKDYGLAFDIQQLRDEMRQTREILYGYRQEMEEVRPRMARCETRLDRLEDRVAALEQPREDAGARDTSSLESVVARLQLDLQEREQELLLNDLDVNGVPEEKGENAVHVIITCAAKIGVNIDERDIVSCGRVGAVRESGGAATRPRPIAVRLARRALRDELMRAARVRRTVTTEGLGLAADARRVYINERLTKTNRRLFYLARETARRLGWRFVWTKDGRVFVRRYQGDRSYRIKQEADLESVFGHDQVRSTDELNK